MTYINGDVPIEDVKARLLDVNEFLNGVGERFEEYNQTEDQSVIQKLSEYLATRWGWPRLGHNMLVLHGACWWSSRMGLDFYPKDIAPLYEQHSGVDAYPVPSPWPEKTPQQAYNGQPDMWLGQYGRDRIAYLRLLRDRAMICSTHKPVPPLLDRK